MDKNIREKYFGFVYAYITSKKICLNGMMKKKYKETFFDDAIKDNILTEIDKNDIGERQFIFTDLAKKLII